MTAPPPRSLPILGWVLLAVAIVAAFLLGMLGSAMSQRRAGPAEGRTPRLGQWESDPAKWGVPFPRQFNAWQSSRRIQPNTAFGGSGERDDLAEHPERVVLWAGYSSARESRQGRGHVHAVEDVAASLRVDRSTPAACWTCKSADVPRLIARDGAAQFYARKFAEVQAEVKNPIACLDCHDPETTGLRVTRPALREALERQGRDVRRATRREMRSLVCAQCHAEYYLKGSTRNEVVFPWDQGLKAEDFEKSYAASGHVDWIHAISGAKMIKMQHPDYELYQQGLHAFRGVSCADCHMPDTSECRFKFTDHGVRSPLYDPAQACQRCHRWTEDEVRSRVTEIQTRTRETMARAERALTAAHLEIGDAARHGATEAELEGVRKRVSAAQMYWDYVAASNGMGFHAPQEAVRVLGKSLDLAWACRHETQRIRARRGQIEALAMPDLSTREKAQAFIKPYVEARDAAIGGTSPPGP